MKKNTNKKLVNRAAKNKATESKKLGNTFVKWKKAAKIKQSVIVATETAKRKALAAKKKAAAATRNSFRRALYRANKIIKNGNSFYKNEFSSMREFKKEYEDFGKRTGRFTGNLDENLKIFLGNRINSRTPKQCESAVDNLMKHLSDAVSALNGVEGDRNKLSDTNKKYIKVLEEISALKTEKNEEKDVYSIIEEKLPDSADLQAVTNKYLNIKRIIIRYFGNQEYAEAYGS